MSIEVMAFLTIVAALFVVGFAGGSVVDRKFHLTRHGHGPGNNRHAH